jgi:hypothetical protein
MAFNTFVVDNIHKRYPAARLQIASGSRAPRAILRKFASRRGGSSKGLALGRRLEPVVGESQGEYLVGLSTYAN